MKLSPKIKKSSTAVLIPCQHCQEWIDLETGLLDSGTTLTCPVCGEYTIIDLFKPEERATLYGFKEKEANESLPQEEKILPVVQAQQNRGKPTLHRQRTGRSTPSRKGN